MEELNALISRIETAAAQKHDKTLANIASALRCISYELQLRNDENAQRD